MESDNLSGQKAAGLLVIVPLAILLNLAGAVICKCLASSLSRIYLAGALLACLGVVYVARTLYWIWVGRRWQLSYLYPVLSVSYFVSFLIGMWVFDEPYSWKRLAGALIIVAGVVMTSLSPNKVDR